MHKHRVKAVRLQVLARRGKQLGIRRAKGGADVYGLTEQVVVVELVDVAHDHVQISGSYEGPILMVQELVGKPEGEN